jgi:hypothetical protein
MFGGSKDKRTTSKLDIVVVAEDGALQPKAVVLDALVV